MRSLADPDVLGRALLAATISAVACYPRLANWSQREDAVWVLLGLVEFTAFAMWAAVFAWHEKHGGRALMPRDVSANFWAITITLGAAGSMAAFHFGDPALRRIAFTDFPQNAHAWAEHLLFNLAMEQLFLCFAPFAVGLRLLPNATAAGVTTVLLGMFVFALKLRSVATTVPPELTVALLAFRAVQSAVTVWIFWRGGLVAVWVFVVLLQIRHWFAFS